MFSFFYSLQSALFDLFDLPLLPDCHPSCRSCVGPLASDCLRCLKPEEALVPQSTHLQHGVCTAGCDARSFLDYTQTCRGECVWFLLLRIFFFFFLSAGSCRIMWTGGLWWFALWILEPWASSPDASHVVFWSIVNDARIRSKKYVSSIFIKNKRLF